MSNLNAREFLCWHDPRHPDGCSGVGCGEDDKCRGRTEHCACDACFRGRDLLAQEILCLRDQLKTVRRDVYMDVVAQRGVRYPEDLCPSCSGLGVKAYGSTSTWRGGPGGQMVTAGVCNKCWGSGSKSRPWTDLRKVSIMHSEVTGQRKEIEALREQLDDALSALEEGGSFGCEECGMSGVVIQCATCGARKE